MTTSPVFAEVHEDPEVGVCLVYTRGTKRGRRVEWLHDEWSNVIDTIPREYNAAVREYDTSPDVVFPTLLDAKTLLLAVEIRATLDRQFHDAMKRYIGLTQHG